MKNVVITGASKGIGYQTALQFAQQGHQVLAISRNHEKLQQLKSEKLAEGRIQIEVLDLVSDFSVDEISKHFKKIDILINNAGLLIKKPFEEISHSDLAEVYTVNVFAPFLMVQKLLPYFNSDAHIINIGSVGGVNGTQKFPGLSIYSSSKAALSSLSECWQAEFEETDLTFNSLALGAVQTEMLSEAFPGYRAPLSAQEMSKYIVRFALEDHLFIKGKTILVSRSNP